MVSILLRLNPCQSLSNPNIRVLVPRSDPTTIDFLCSCETYDFGTSRTTVLIPHPLSDIVDTPFVPSLLLNRRIWIQNK